MGVTCCKDCKDRNENCHAVCEKYAKQKAEYAAEAEKKNAKKKNEHDALSYLCAIKTRIIRGNWRK